MDFGEIGDLSCWFDLYNVSKSDSKIFSDGFVHAYFRVIQLGIAQADDNCLFSLLALDEDGVSFEDLEFVHLGLADLDGGIFVIECFIDLDEWVCTMSLLGAFF